MYEAFFHLNARPFPSTPRIDRYFPAAAIENSRQTLARCIERAEGPGLLVGGPGTGKSLVCALLADQFRERFHVVKLDHARFCTRRALLQAMMFELNLPYRGLDEGELRLAMIEFAKSPDAAREGLLLIIDEAQTLSVRLIEEIRMITNVVVGGQSRLRPVLSGNSALEERLSSPKLESLNQRIAARCYLPPLNYDETAAYTRAQLAAAGGDPDRILAGDIWQAVYHASGGIPRLINQVCDHALMLAAAAQRPALDAALVEESWADLQQLPLPWPSKAQAAKGAENVVEFGSLDGSDEDGSNKNRGDEDSADGAGELPPRPAAGRPEVIDLTSQLEQIELHVAEWEDPEAAADDDADDDAAQEEDNETSPEPAPSVAEIEDSAANPFGDGFEEEAVRDHYAELEAQSGLRGARPLSLQEHEFTAALQTIFQPLAGSVGADRAAQTVPAGVSETAPTPAAVAVSEDAVSPGDEAEDAAAGAAAGDDPASSAEAFQNAERETLRVAALRDLPPDDSDLILVMDAQSHVAPLSRMAGKAHRQEYRHLFTKLRES
ncbi:MAG: AAA family ATPase [Candidatus Anammoximicrobium sp.]|nr:AAA family ATPase [Candidatus Anammoximicrobium sp.]